jgi:hypothetical protein
LLILKDILRIKNYTSLAGIKTAFQVGAYSDSEGMDAEAISLVAGSPEKRSKLLSNILEIAKKFEFDGVTFVWLFPGCPQVTKRFYSLYITKSQCKWIWLQGKCSTIKVRDRAKILPLFSELGTIMKNEGKISVLFSLCNDPKVNWYLGIETYKLSCFS